MESTTPDLPKPLCLDGPATASLGPLTRAGHVSCHREARLDLGVIPNDPSDGVDCSNGLLGVR